jgi:hypothetical protein
MVVVASRPRRAKVVRFNQASAKKIIAFAQGRP